MKITQYITTNGLTFEKRPVFPAVYASGAMMLTAGDSPVSEDFLGFGVAITGSSCYNLAQMDAAERRALLENVYTKKGLGLSVARLSVGASDYSAELYSYDDVEGDVELKHFSIDRDRAYVIPMIKEILAVNPDLYLFASPWSPPGWMKTGGSLCGGFMRDEFVECYADYYVRFLQEYEKCGVHISALTPQNEPETHQRGRMPGCMWHPDTEAKFIKVLRRKLIEQGMDVKIWMFDHNFYHVDYRVRWSLDHCDGLKDACDGIALHYYLGAIEDTLSLQEAYPQLRMHFTEGGPRLHDNYDSDWCKWGVMISKVLNHNYGSFTGWNLMLDETGGPNVGPFFCGGLITRNSVTGALSYSGQYRALEHIAKFMDRSSKVYPLSISRNSACIANYPKSPAPLQASMIENKDGTRIYLLVNPDTEKKQVQFEIDGTYYYVEMLPNTLATVVVER
jgi:glucosylceramidase